MQAVAKWRAGFRVSLVRTQEPEGGGWEPSARIRAFRSQLRARTRSTESPPDFPARRGRNPVAGRKWINSGRKRAVYNLGGPPFVEFRDSLKDREKPATPGRTA